jgi:hypothetical protein
MVAPSNVGCAPAPSPSFQSWLWLRLTHAANRVEGQSHGPNNKTGSCHCWCQSIPGQPKGRRRRRRNGRILLCWILECIIILIERVWH